MPIRDLRSPAADSTTQLVDLRWAGLALEIVGELVGVSKSNRWTVDGIDLSYGFLGVPGTAHLAVGVTGVEKATKTCPAAAADAFVGVG